MRLRSFVFLTVATFSAHALAAPADIVSDFSVNDEGWAAANVDFPNLSLTEPPQAPTYDSAGGFIGASESIFRNPGLFLLVGPSKFNVDLNPYYGGSVSFDLSDALHDSGAIYPSLILIGLDTSTGLPLTIGYLSDAPETSLTSYLIPLEASDPRWITSTGGDVTETQMKSVLGNMLGFAINADWTTNGIDVVTLDNVRVKAVPEPVTIAGLGLAFVGLAQRRRSRSPRSS